MKFLLFNNCFGPISPDPFATLYVLVALVFIIFVILPRIKFPITDIAKINTKNPYYKTRNVLGFYEEVKERGELCVLETKKHSILYKIIAVSLSSVVLVSYLGTFLNFESWY